MNRRSVSRMVVACIVLLASCIPVMAQEGAPGLEVSDFQNTYTPAWSSRRGVTHDAGASDLSSRPAIFELSALFRNTGTKVITSVSWECLFFGDERQTEVLLRHKFRDAKRIMPGEEVRLKRASARGAATKYKAARITRVAYADGTVWQAAKTGGETPSFLWLSAD